MAWDGALLSPRVTLGVSFQGGPLLGSCAWMVNSEMGMPRNPRRMTVSIGMTRALQFGSGFPSHSGRGWWPETSIGAMGSMGLGVFRWPVEE
jgi:hypothetical protein